MNLIDADELIELINDDIASLDNDMPREGDSVCLCTLKMVKQYIEAMPTVPLDWKSILDDWTEHDNAMIAKGREIERRLNATKHGHWEGDGQCSACKEYPLARYMENPNYCPNCGARMDEVENG